MKEVVIYLLPGYHERLSWALPREAVELLDGYTFTYPTEYVLTCDEREAKALLETARRHCPEAVYSISNDIRVSLGSRN